MTSITSPKFPGSFAHHGGNLAAALRAFPHAPRPFIDLSTGINPLPYPVGEISAEAWARLPDADAEARLITAARAAYGMNGSDQIVAAPGTQALIQLLPLLRPGARVAVLGPTYNEHAATWASAGCTVREVSEIEELVTADVAVVVNPNNPTGRVVDHATFRELAASLSAKGGLLIIDEAFADLEPGVSLIPDGVPAGALVLRSFGKTYGLAGLRLGFAIGGERDIAPLATRLGPWAVSGPALEVGARALADSKWREASWARLTEDAQRLDQLLASIGFQILGGTHLFRLAAHDDAAGIANHLARNGILIRPFDYNPSWLRFGIPGMGDWVRLEGALGNFSQR